MTDESPTLEQKRSMFAAYRNNARRLLNAHGKSDAAIEGFIRKIAKAEGGTPDAYIAGAKAAFYWGLKTELAAIPEDAREECSGCAGDGRYWFSATNSGPCYRCEGKGTESKRDQCRNRWYDALYRRVRI